VVLVLFFAGVGRGLERSTVDARFALRGTQPVPRDVAVVAVDPTTFSELHLQWPFRRSLDARVIDRLHAAGAKVIVFDVQFTEPTVPSEDNKLIEAIANARPMTLAATEVGPGGSTDVLGGAAVLRSVGARAGNANFVTDDGGTIRRVPYELDGLKSLSIVAAEQALGRAISPSELGGSSAWIDFAGPAGRVPTYSFSRVLAGKVSPAAFRGRVVVVGATAPTLQDIHGVPLGGVMPGPEIQANAIETALRGFPLQGTSLWVGALLIVALALLVPLAALRVGPVAAVSVAVVAGLAYAATCQLAFSAGTVLPLVHPLIALGGSTVLVVAVLALLAAFERQRVRDAFARFVPEAVVDQVLARADGLRLGGEQVTATLMFTDLRGFTTFSEGRPAAEVIEILNHYLEEMVNAILEHGGTIVSFLGDGIMALFGAPIPQDDHADRALATGRQMLLDRLPAVNAWLAEHGHQAELKMGIGLNSGLVVTGNVGSEQRLEYTAIGDAVNTASRIESLTKTAGYPLLLSEETRLHLLDLPSGLVELGELPIRGRTSGVRLWSLGELAPANPPV